MTVATKQAGKAMRDALSKVRKALTTSSIAPQLAFVRIAGGTMSATDGRLYAATPTECADDFVVSGKQLEKALALSNDLDMKFDGQFVTFSHGRTRVKIETLDGSSFPVVTPPADDTWQPFDGAFVDALIRIRPFISDNATQAWALGAHAHALGVAATNNVVLADVDHPHPPVMGLVPFWLIDFVAAAPERPTAISSTADIIYLRWADGTWLQSLRIAGVFPEAAVGLLSKLRERTDDGWRLSPEWREAYRKTLEFADNDIVIGPKAISTRGKNMEVETAIETGVEGPTLWDTRFAGAVLRAATHWRIGDYPKPSYWHGDGIRGVIVGKVGA